MKIVHWSLDRIRPYENNPRINDAAVDAVARSIEQFGFRQPIVVDTDGVIVCGHTRWKAATKLKLKTVPVHIAKDLTPEQIKAYRIADNQTASLADWDYDLLPIELSDLQSMDFDLSLLGFAEDELAKLLDPDVRDGLTDPDEIPEPPDEATTQPGDLWILGNHRLLCGDSSDADDVDRLLDGAPIHLVNTDPPYNVKVEPRSNNAIAAGLSSFQAKNHQRFDVKRHPEKSKATHRKMRAKDRPRERPDMPDWLDADARNCWDSLVPLLEQLGVLRRIDGKALARYCSMWVRWRKCQEFLTKNGETYMLKGADGKPRCVMQWPQVSISNKLATLLLRIEQEFGMTPASRPNLHVDSSLDDYDPFLDSEFLPPPQKGNSQGR